MVFLLGSSDDPSTESLVSKEMRLYRDILQWRFNDTYHNLAVKTLLGLNWIHSNCDKTKFVLKTDDDVYLDVPNIVKFLLQWNTNMSNPILIGHENKKSPVLRIGQWGVASDQYKSDVYPPYCSGAAYIMNLKTVQHMIHAVHRNPTMVILPIEDVFISGILVSTIGEPFQDYEPRIINFSKL